MDEDISTILIHSEEAATFTGHLIWCLPFKNVTFWFWFPEPISSWDPKSDGGVSSVLPLLRFYQHNRCKEAALHHSLRERYGKRQVWGFGQKWMPWNSPGQGEHLHSSGQFCTSTWIITYNCFIGWRLCIFLLKRASEHLETAIFIIQVENFVFFSFLFAWKHWFHTEKHSIINTSPKKKTPALHGHVFFSSVFGVTKKARCSQLFVFPWRLKATISHDSRNARKGWKWWVKLGQDELWRENSIQHHTILRE